MKLTRKQERHYKLFAKEYIIDFNGQNAAIRAGYSKRAAHVQASRMLKNVKVQEFIKKEIEKREERTEVTQDRVLKEIAKLAFADMAGLYDEDGKLIPPYLLDKDTAATISSFKERTEHRRGDEQDAIIEEYKRYDKPKALEMLGRHLGMFNDKLKVEGKVEVHYYAPKKDKDK